MHKLHYWIGCSGWQYREWYTHFYPENCPRSAWFNHYAQHFNSVEINSTFYHFPTEKTLLNWYQQAPQNFCYSLKVNRTITHFKRFENCEREINKFYNLAETLKEKLGCILFQLPPSLIYSEAVLEKCVKQLNKQYHNVIEFRHPSWWQSDVYKALTQENIAFCSINAPKLPNTLITNLPFSYIRLHGTKRWFNGHYDKNYLEKLLQTTINSISQNLWIYFNNTMDGSAPFDALQLKALFELTK